MERSSHLVIEGRRYTISPSQGRDRDYMESFGEREAGPRPNPEQDYPIEEADFSLGMGYSEKLLPGTYAWGKNIDCRTPRVVLPGPKKFEIDLPEGFTAPIVDFQWFDGDLWILTQSNQILRLPNGTDTAAVVGATLGASFSGVNFAVFESKLYASGGGSAKMAVKPLGNSFNQLTGSGAPNLMFNQIVQQYWEVYIPNGKVTGYQLVAVDGTDPTRIWHVPEGSDPNVPGNWAGPVKVGNGYPIRGLAASNRKVFAICDDGVFAIAETYAQSNLTEYWKTALSPLNGQSALIYRGNIFVSHYLGADYIPLSSQGTRIDVSEYAHPSAGLPNETPIYGPVSASCMDNGWIVASFYNGRDSHICYGRERGDSPGIGPILWHGSLCTIEGEKVTALKVIPTSPAPRMFIGTNGPSIYYYTIPNAANPLQDWNLGGYYRFEDEASLVCPSEIWGNATYEKFLTRVDVQADALGKIQAINPATMSLEEKVISIDVSANKENEPFQVLGTAASSPRSIIYPAKGYLKGHRIAIKFDLHSHTEGSGSGFDTYPAIFRAAEVHAGVIAEQRRKKQYSLTLGGQIERRGGFTQTDPDEDWEYLVAMQMKGPIDIIDELGKTRCGRVLSGVRRAEIIDNKNSVDRNVADIELAFFEEIEIPEVQVIDTYTGPRWNDDVSEWGNSDGSVWNAEWQDE